MDDKVQAALDEAQQLMSELGSEEIGISGSGAGGGDPISFSIDSDDEGEDGEEVDLGGNVATNPITTTTRPVDSHPLSGVEHHPLLPTPSTTGSTTSAPPSTASSTSTPPISNISSSFTNPLMMMTGQSQQQPPQQPNQQQQPIPQAPSSGGAPHPLSASMGSASAPTSSSMSMSNSGLLGDSWKQQTSRFASAMGSMAKQVAQNVVNATSTQPPPNNMGSTGPPSIGSASSYGSNAAVITSVPSQGNETLVPPAQAGVAPPQQQQQQQQQQQHPHHQMLHAELDNEQKAALIRAHVGNLLPGERVIMFVANLLHVSDSTGFSYTAPTTTTAPTSANSSSGKSSAIWCCAMTYYRLILFGTHPFSPPACPPDWNTACWPYRPVHLLQMPLASMERVEKSVFSASTTSTTAGGAPNSGGSSNPIPLMGMANPVPSSAISTTSLMGLHIVGKDNGRTLRFTTPSYADTVRAHEALQTYAFPGRRNLGYLFAFESKKDDVMKSIVTDGQGQKQVTLEPTRQRFQAHAEFTRQFQKNSSTHATQSPPWTLFANANAQYQLCPSYPSVLAGPSSINENNPESLRVLQQSATFRSEQRLPVLTYAHTLGGGSLWRCSQPKTGFQGNRNPADEWLLKQILDQASKANQAVNGPAVSRQVLLQLTGAASLEQFHSNWLPSAVSGSELKILDLRPRSSAMANRTAGYGYENTSNYPGSTLQFCGIGNIHAVRDAYQKVSTVCLSTTTQDVQFASQTEDSKWLSHIRGILAASWETAYWVHVFQLPVLLHCSHGWDRTSQVAALAQLLLDPYYRTMEGFACLVEKDFMSFGHPFHTRCAHGVGTGGGGGNNQNNNIPGNSNGMNGSDFDEGQVSPIFLQFLDCAYQLVALYPEAFEITTRYLLDLSDHVYSCRFGNFLCDTERERETVAGIRQRTHSVWDFLEARHKHHNHNGNNMDEDHEEERGEDRMAGGVLLMPLPTLLRNVTLWADRHTKFSPKATLRWLPPTLSVPTHTHHPDGRHDDDTPQFHRLPTQAEAQAQLYEMTKIPKTEKGTPVSTNEGAVTAPSGASTPAQEAGENNGEPESKEP